MIGVSVLALAVVAVPGSAALGTAAINGVVPPFADQPVQGFSGIVRNSDGTFDVLSDNGYGNKANSADFTLRIQRIAPDFAGGAVDVVGGLTLTDPNRHLASSVTASHAASQARRQGSVQGFARKLAHSRQVPFPLTRPDRVLTGADFDIESIVRLADGSYWIGDEFGPYLLHVDRAGRLLAPPVPLPGVFAPENPAGTSNLPSSKGFEGLGLAPDQRTLNTLLEGTVAGDEPGTLRLNEFDLAAGRYTGTRWTYQMDDPRWAIGDAISVDRHRLLVIERDGSEGAAARQKKIYLADKRDRDRDGKLDKTLVADLHGV